ncbi:acyl-CoA dehydrogenase NM domain-like protein [Aureobasidium pullulans]|nr:acyl-CoA dehydrogenase NM domain-like protein [Aureobasidium pullulans]
MASVARSMRPLMRPSSLQSPLRQRVLSRPCWRSLSTSQSRRQTTTGEPNDLTDALPTPITHFSETEHMMAESVGKFANDVILPKVRSMDEAEKMDQDIIEQCFEQGLMGIEIPEEFGGAGMNFTAAIVGIEELARVDPSVSVMVDVHNTLVNTTVLKYGTNESKRKWLPQLATNTVGSFCLSEPVSGSDAFALKTRAEKTADGYRINGSKMWITNSLEAGFFIVFANLDPSKGYKGITAFIVDKDTPGFSIAKKEKKLGIKASSTCVVNFDDCDIPKGNLLGEEGHGYKYAIGILNEGRIGIAAQMTGLAMGAFSNAASYVWNDRKQFGTLVGEFQGMQHQLAQAWTEICAARAMVYNAARKKEAGEDFVMDAAMAKLYASQVAGRVSGQAIEWMGGMGFVREGLAEKYWRDSKIGAIYEGTSNIQLTTIARFCNQLKYRAGMLSLKNPLVYLMFHPLAYVVKLKIEMSMAELIAHVARNQDNGPVRFNNPESSSNGTLGGKGYTFNTATSQSKRDSIQKTPVPAGDVELGNIRPQSVEAMHNHFGIIEEEESMHHDHEDETGFVVHRHDEVTVEVESAPSERSGKTDGQGENFDSRRHTSDSDEAPLRKPTNNMGLNTKVWGRY